tara:strand:- start:44 stop:271 length:228 start_codon:yes stop_codon:yes gene_type:complete
MGWYKSDSMCGSPSLEPWNEYHDPDCEDGQAWYCETDDVFIEKDYLNWCSDCLKFIPSSDKAGQCIGKQLAYWKS